jgi:putative transcriptional regulator
LIRYKIDILEELKRKGYTTYILRKNKYLSETTIANIRAGKPITMNALDAICVMLRKTPEEIINFEISDSDKIKYFV